MKDKVLTAWVTEKVYKQIMEAYMKHFTTGKCTSKSDYIRQALSAYASNGDSPPITPPIKDTNSDDKQVKEPKSDLADAFDQIDI